MSSEPGPTSLLPEGRRPPPTTIVTEGAWSFEVRGDEVADIRYAGVLLLRAVRAVVRDQDWNTIPVTVERHREEPSQPGARTVLSLRFRGPGSEGPVDYLGELTVDVRPDELLVTFDGTAVSAFPRNRIGLVVLHPLSEAGRRVAHVRTDGSVEPSSWPTAISPHQPFTDVAGFRWDRDGVAAELALEGEVFETEDQRNWTDASFKTYGTPLSVPFPVEVRPGDKVVQSARLRARTSATPPARPEARHPEAAVVRVGDEVVGAVPALSVGASADPHVPAWAADLGFETVLVELSGPVSTWSTALDAAASQAAALGAALDVRVVCTRPEEVEHAVSLLDPGRVVRVGVFDRQRHVPTRELWDALQAAAAGRPLAATLLAGTRGHFAELNRTIGEQPADAAGLTCTITPQMHATELPHVLDSLEGQQAVARDATRLAVGRPVWVGPVTLRQRFNAVATSEAAAAPAPDPLQTTAFTAAWALGSVAALTRPRIAGVCYFELSGPGGLGDAHGLYPVGRVLASLADLRGQPVLASRATAGLACYAVREASGTRVFVARLHDEAVPCEVHGLSGGVRTLTLEPWSVTELRGS